MSDRNGDRYTFSESTSTSNSQPVYTSKQYSYQIDQNNSSYGSKQIIFDLSGFYNSQRFIDPKEMFMMFPVLSTMTAANSGPSNHYSGLGSAPKITQANGLQFADNGGAHTNQFAMGYKSGYWNLINSIQIQVDGKDVIQLTPNINYHASFVANTTWSDSDVKKHGALTGFIPDSSNSWMISNEPSADGLGICNNRLPPSKKLCPYPTNETWAVAGGYPAIRASDGAALLVNDVIAVRANDGPKISSQLGVSHDFNPFQQNCEANHGLWERMKTTNRFYDRTVFPVPPADGIGELSKQQNSTCQRMASGDNGGGILTDEGLAALLQNRLKVTPDANVPTINGLYGWTDNTSEDALSTTAIRQLETVCIVRFKDVCDLFNNLPLTRGLYMRVILNMNTGSTEIGAIGRISSIVDAAIAVGGGLNSSRVRAGPPKPQDFPAYNSVLSNTFPGTCPIMLTPMVVSALQSTVGNGADQFPLATFSGNFPATSSIQLYPGVAVDCGTYLRESLILSVSIAKMDPIHSSRGFTGPEMNHSMANCRIFAPIIDMEPALTNSYITAHKDQAIYYRDVLAFRYPSVPSNSPFTYQIANGIVNAKRLIIIPFYNHSIAKFRRPTVPAVVGNIVAIGATGDGNYALDGSIPWTTKTYQALAVDNLFEPMSVFDSAPSTVAPQSALTDFNVLVSNMNIFQRNISYDFENFIEEISPANAINGGLDTGLTSGLIDFTAWSQNYRYYVVDLSRRLAGDNTPKSLTVVGNNRSKFDVDYFFYVEYERHLSLDVESGHISVSSN